MKSIISFSALALLTLASSALADSPLAGDYRIENNGCMSYLPVGAIVNLDAKADVLTIGQVVDCYGRRAIQAPTDYPVGDFKRQAMCGGHCFFRTVGAYSDDATEFKFAESDGDDLTPEHVLRTTAVYFTEPEQIVIAKTELEQPMNCLLTRISE